MYVTTIAVDAILYLAMTTTTTTTTVSIYSQIALFWALFLAREVH